MECCKSNAKQCDLAKIFSGAMSLPVVGGNTRRTYPVKHSDSCTSCTGRLWAFGSTAKGRDPIRRWPFKHLQDGPGSPANSSPQSTNAGVSSDSSRMDLVRWCYRRVQGRDDGISKNFFVKFDNATRLIL